jgi:hypothetical protein
MRKSITAQIRAFSWSSDGGPGLRQCMPKERSGHLFRKSDDMGKYSGFCCLRGRDADCRLHSLKENAWRQPISRLIGDSRQTVSSLPRCVRDPVQDCSRTRIYCPLDRPEQKIKAACSAAGRGGFAVRTPEWSAEGIRKNPIKPRGAHRAGIPCKQKTPEVTQINMGLITG